MPNMSKKHNYLIVYDANGGSHFLDRYWSPAEVARMEAIEAELKQRSEHPYAGACGEADGLQDELAALKCRTLCGLAADKTEIEHDEMGYSGGITCAACKMELQERVLA